MHASLVKRLLALGIALCFACLLSSCSSSESAAPQAGDGRLKVAVTFDAMKEFAQAVGGEKADIYILIPDGSEPHDFQPTTKTIKELHQAQLLICNGMGMEPWAEKTAAAANNSRLKVIDASQGVTPIALTDEEEIKEHGAYDPHVWLSLENAQIEVTNIASAMADADPENADYYRHNAASYNQQLQELLDEYKEKFSTVSHKDFVTGHEAFAYLCRDFNLTQLGVESVFSGGEPNARQLASLTDFCKKNHVTTIFVEDMVSPKTSETLAREIGADVEPIHTMESSHDGQSYLERMNDNLSKIYQALK